MRGGRSFRQALPPERWEAAGLFLRSLTARSRCGRVRVGAFLREYRSGRMPAGGTGSEEMIADGGAEELLTAVIELARADLEVVFERVVLLQKACERGCLAQFVAANGLPLAAEDERTALWWYEGRRGLAKELAEMVALIVQYRRYCLGCCRLTGRIGDGRPVQRRRAGGIAGELSRAESAGGDRGRGAEASFSELHGQL